ncbi:dipeptide epimerase [uncultured Sphingomonas sp.]|uniref:dipeptide epimerase n=1 Tax=uncultured Sphingomonas sp. TaxID=158754 RepID=UPI00345DD362
MTAEARAFPLRAPFRIARGVKTVAEVVEVRIEEAGFIGRGEGVPYPRYGESVASALAAIEAARGAVEAGADCRDLLSLMPAGAARNVVDAALWDLDVKLGRASLPPAMETETAVTVGIDTPVAMHAAALALGPVPLVKVKVDGEAVADRVAAVRSALPAARMIVDANESWTLGTLRAALPALVEARIDLVEQPLPADADDALVGIDAPFAIAADESAHGIGDLDRLRGRYSHINIKLDKTGGLTAALALADAAERVGMGVMLGCMVASSLGIAPAIRLAGRASFVDLDGPWWLAADRTGGVRIEQGVLTPPVPGFWA